MTEAIEDNRSTLFLLFRVARPAEPSVLRHGGVELIEKLLVCHGDCGDSAFQSLYLGRIAIVV